MKKIVAPHAGGNPYGVQTAHAVDWHKEHQQRAQTKGNGSLFHQRDSSSVLSVLIEYAEFILNYFAIDSAKRRGFSGLFSPCGNYDLRLDNCLLQ